MHTTVYSGPKEKLANKTVYVPNSGASSHPKFAEAKEIALKRLKEAVLKEGEDLRVKEYALYFCHALKMFDTLMDSNMRMGDMLSSCLVEVDDVKGNQNPKAKFENWDRVIESAANAGLMDRNFVSDLVETYVTLRREMIRGDDQSEEAKAARAKVADYEQAATSIRKILREAGRESGLTVQPTVSVSGALRVA